MIKWKSGSILPLNKKTIRTTKQWSYKLSFVWVKRRDGANKSECKVSSCNFLFIVYRIYLTIWMQTMHQNLCLSQDKNNQYNLIVRVIYTSLCFDTISPIMKIEILGKKNSKIYTCRLNNYHLFEIIISNQTFVDKPNINLHFRSDFHI